MVDTSGDLEDLTAADLVIFDNFTSYLLFKSLINRVFYPLYVDNTKQSNPKGQYKILSS